MTLLKVRNLDAFYGDLQALFDVSIELAEGETVALVGANGAGKSTLLKCVVGLIDSKRGDIQLAGQTITTRPAERIAPLGVALVPEGRLLFPSLTVEENLLMGGLTKRSGYWNLAQIYDLFPVLQQRRRQLATRLSGGEQQMVAIGRALMANPRVLLCDEISLGLAPVVIEQIYRSFDRIRAAGQSVLLIEQDVARAYTAADRIYCMLKGRVTMEGQATTLSLDQISHAYFGA